MLLAAAHGPVPATRTIRTGARTVKNVTGYDVMKLHIGAIGDDSRGGLGHGRQCAHLAEHHGVLDQLRAIGLERQLEPGRDAGAPAPKTPDAMLAEFFQKESTRSGAFPPLPRQNAYAERIVGRSFFFACATAGVSGSRCGSSRC